MPPEDSALGHAVLRLENLSKRYGERAALFEGLQLTLVPGEYLAVMGESGVGKSTLLNLLAGLEAPSSGRIWLDGAELGPLSDDDVDPDGDVPFGVLRLAGEGPKEPTLLFHAVDHVARRRAESVDDESR